jgi:hypothetical protein
MPGPILKTGDLAMLAPLGPQIVPALLVPAPLTGTAIGKSIKGKMICVKGDELPLPWRIPTMYTCPPYVIPGMGVLTSVDLPATSYSVPTKWAGKPAMLLGPPAQVEFKVMVPAIMMSGPVPVPDASLTKKFMLQYIPTIPVPVVLG